jgi:hypothetical protein
MSEIIDVKDERDKQSSLHARVKLLAKASRFIRREVVIPVITHVGVIITAADVLQSNY